MGPFLLALVCAFAAPIQGDADEAYAYIAGLSEKGLNELVVKEAQTFLREHPAHPKALHARYRLACALIGLERRPEAATILLTVASDAQFEFVGEANVRLGECELALGDAAAAEKAFTRALELGREYLRPGATALRAEARFARADWKGASTEWSAVLNASSTPEDKPEDKMGAQIGLAWCAYRVGDPARAVELARAVLDARAPRKAAGKDQPAGGARDSAGNEAHAHVADKAKPTSRDDELRCLIGEASLDLGRVREALDAFRSVRDAALFDAAARGAGYALAASGDHAAAAREFARVPADRPDSRFARECALHWGIELLAAKDAAGARAALASPSVGDDAEALYWRARAELEAGDAQAALGTLDRALAKPLDAQWKERLAGTRGSALEKLGRHAEAAHAWESSGSIDALQAAAAADLADGRAADAALVARKILDRSPAPEKTASAWLVLGEALMAAKQWAEGEKAFLAAATVDPDVSRAARAGLRAAWCRWFAGDAAGARTMFDAATRSRLDPIEMEEASFMRARAAELALESPGASSAARADALGLYREHLAQHATGAHATEACIHMARLSDDAAAIAILEGITRGPSAAHSPAANLPPALVAQASYDLAERLSAQKRWTDATRHYADCVARDPNSKLAQSARYGLAWCAFSSNDFDGAAHALADLLGAHDLEPDLRGAALELAIWTAIRRGDPEPALAAWRAALGHDLGSKAQTGVAVAQPIVIARSLVALLAKTGRTRDAHAVLDDLQRKTPSGPLVLQIAALRVRLFVDEKRLDDAASELARASRTSGAGDAEKAMLADGAFALAEARFDSGDDRRAIEGYARAVEDAHLADRALYKRGFARLRAQDNRGAEADFARVVAEHPRSPLAIEAQFLRGEALFRQDLFDDAIACFEHVRHDAPDHVVIPKVLFRLGLALAQRERWREAADALGALVRAKPDFESLAEAELARGRALAHLGDARGARAAFERVTANDKGSLADHARIEIGRLLVASKDLDGATAQFLKVAVLSNDDAAQAEALFEAGDALAALGQADHARDRWREVVEKHAASSFAARARERLTAARAEPPVPSPSGPSAPSTRGSR